MEDLTVKRLEELIAASHALLEMFGDHEPLRTTATERIQAYTMAIRCLSADAELRELKRKSIQ